jgi:hypothetical protein
VFMFLTVRFRAFGPSTPYSPPSVQFEQLANSCTSQGEKRFAKTVYQSPERPSYPRRACATAATCSDFSVLACLASWAACCNFCSTCCRRVTSWLISEISRTASLRAFVGPSMRASAVRLLSRAASLESF